MKKLIVTFAILCIVLIITRVLFAYYVDTVPVFSALLTPLLWLSVVAGVLAGVFVVIVIYSEIKAVKRKPPKGDE